MVPNEPEFRFLSILLQYCLKFTDDNFYIFYDYSTSFKKIYQVFMAQVLFKNGTKLSRIPIYLNIVLIFT